MAVTRRGLLALVIGSLGLAAATALAVSGAGALASSGPAGTTGSVLATGDLGAALTIREPGRSTVTVVSLRIAPGGNGGWHSHVGASLMTVTGGTATLYEDDSGSCTVRRYGKGSSFLEHPGRVHVVRNEGRTPVTLNAVLVAPRGTSPGTEQPVPADCRKRG